MRLKLSLVKADGVRSDIAITADATATVAEVAARIDALEPAAAGPQPAGDSGRRTLRVAELGMPHAVTLDPDMPVGDARIASGSDVSVVSADLRGWDSGAGGPVLAVLRVESGKDKGTEFQLRAGTTVIGRDESADLVLSDGLVSKRHARIEVTETVDFVDLNSANGLLVDGSQVTRASLRSGQSVVIGDSTLRAQLVQHSAAPVQQRRGPVAFNRSPRVEPRFPGTLYDGVDIPRHEDPPGFPWAMLIIPPIMGYVLYQFTGSIIVLVMMSASPVLMLGNFFTQHLSRRAKMRRQKAEFEEALASLTQQLTADRVEEHRVRHEEAPSTELLLHHAATLGQSLWTRRPEHWSFLNLRFGTGSARSRNAVKRPKEFTGIAEFREQLVTVIDAFERVGDVPIVDNMADAGAVGVAGSQTAATEAANALLVQLTSLYSPAEVTFSAILSQSWAKGLDWIKWLPHVGSPQSPLTGSELADGAVSANQVLVQLEALIQERTGQRNTGARRGPIDPEKSVMLLGPGESGEGDDEFRPRPPIVVLLISADAEIDRARATYLTERAVAAGILPIWLADTTAQLPAACRTYLEIGDGSIGVINMVRIGETIRDAQFSRVSREQSLAYARSLSGVTDASALSVDDSDLPKSVSLAGLLGTDLMSQTDAVIDRWRQNDSISDREAAPTGGRRRAGKLRAIVGQSAVDSMALDLRAQGPHALVGGTTGSGKSEFLQAWVLGMAAEYSPDRVTFLFVDYKGGSAFADCVNLPHCVGLVTDLSPHLVRRALTSLRAELHHREHLLNRKKAKDLIELERRGDPDSPPALVLVIDEFAALASDVPEFVDGVVDIAQRGRSLGIHLIMATQRPAGVIKDNLRANTNLRIALRMADESDSQDVLGSIAAAHFDPSIPGRGVAKSGPGRLMGFQTGYAGGWTTGERAAPQLEIADLAFGQQRIWQPEVEVKEETTEDPGPNDTARMVASFRAAAAEAKIPAPRKPWLDELSSLYDLAKLKQRSDDELLIGVADDATKQQQYPVYFRPDTDGNLAVYGAGGSGKSVLLRTIATAAAITPRGGPVQVYGIEFGSGGLRILEALPHVGAIVPGDDAERVARIMKRLIDTIEERTARYGAVRAGSIAEYRRLANAPEEPRILLLIDGMASFRQEYEFLAGAIYSRLQRVLGEGRAVGVHVVVSADRPGSMSGVIASTFQRRVILRLVEETDYLVLDAPSDVLGPGSPPGRGLLDGLDVQVAVLGGTANGAEQGAAVEKLAAALEARGVQRPAPIERLAEIIPLDTLPVVPGSFVLGVDDEFLAPVTVPVEGGFMLTGPPASGRSTTLASILEGIRRGVPEAQLFYFGPAKSTLKDAPGIQAAATSPEQAVELARRITELAAEPAKAGHRIAVIVESASEFLSTPADMELVAMIKQLKRGDHFVLGEGETSTWSQSWPLLAEFKSGRRGFALQPDQQEGDLLYRTSFPRMKRADLPVGRGLLVAGGTVRKVQAAIVSARPES